MRLIVGISGSTGAIYGVRLLQVLRDVPDVETHLVMSDAARLTIEYETEYSPDEVLGWADHVHGNRDVGASISSGSFVTAGMVVAPCSIKTLASVAASMNDNLLTRAADVCLKERRKLVLVPRETPLHLVQLRNLAACAEAGAVVLPAMPAFYTRPRSLQDAVDFVVGRVCDQLGVGHDLLRRWGSEPPAG